MDLSQGICNLCTNNTKIVVPPQAEATTSFLKDIFADEIDFEKFEKVNYSLKVCPVCLHDVLAIVDFKANIEEDLSKDPNCCVLCYSKQNLVSTTNWTNFENELKNFKSEKILGKHSTCFNCIKGLKLLKTIKTNLFKKYPHLKLSDFAKDRKLNEEPTMKKSNLRTYGKSQHSTKIKFVSDKESKNIPQSKAKHVNNLRAALKHLKPLRNTPYNTDKFQEDKKLLKQIAFVKLSISNLSIKNYKKLEHQSNAAEKSNMINNLQDSDFSNESSSSKQSFFKIRLKINSNKTKAQRIVRGKVTKPKVNDSKFLSGSKKELIVKIIKMNLDKITDLDYEYKKTVEITPTKASRKMMPEDCTSSSKKRKSVTFADVLDSDITNGQGRKETIDSTPLKSSLKRNVLARSGRLKSGNGESSDESENEINTARKRTEKNLNSDEDEEFVTAKSYVDEILKNNDDIFDSLKTSTDTEVIPVNTTKARGSFGIDGNSVDSEDEQKIKLCDKIQDKITEEDGTINISKEVNSIDCENSEENGKKESTIQTEGEFSDFRKNTKDNTSIHNRRDSDNINPKSKAEETKLSTKNIKDGALEEIVKGTRLGGSTKLNNKEVIDIDSSKITSKSSNAKNGSSKHNKHDKQKNSPSSKKYRKSESKELHQKHKKTTAEKIDIDIPETPTEKDGKSKGLVDKIDHAKEIVNTTNSEHKISLSEVLRNKKNSNEDQSGSSMDDDEVTLEEFKKLKKKCSDKDTKIVEDTNNPRGTIILDDEEKTNENDNNQDNINNEISIKEKDKNMEIDNIKTAHTEFDSENTSSKNSNTYDSNNFRLKSKKRRASTMERQDEDEETLTLSKDCEESEEPETKREKVSGVNDLNKTEIEENVKASKTTNEDEPLVVPGKRSDVGTVDDKIDELIAQYTNPSIPKLNYDHNVSDSQNVGAGGDDPGSRSDDTSRGSGEAVDLGTSIVTEKSTENVDVENSSNISDITINNAPDASNVTLKDFDFDNILDNTVDSC